MPIFFLFAALALLASSESKPAAPQLPPPSPEQNPLAAQYITERNNIVRTAVANKWSKAKLAQALQMHTAKWKGRASADELIEWSIVAATVAQHDAATRYV